MFASWVARGLLLGSVVDSKVGGNAVYIAKY